MLRYLRQTFFEPRGERWFGLGLIIESASAPVADLAFAKLRDALPYANFDLLSKIERPGLGFRYMFHVKHPLGGLRLLLRARKHYDLVVLFAAGEPLLRLCRAVALLVMRPRRFFVFNELGDGFWLDREHWPQVCAHLLRRYDWEGRRQRWRRRWEALVSAAQAFGRAALRLAWLSARLLRGLALLLCASLFFIPAFLLLALLRTCYDTRRYRFRFFGKTAAAPQRELGITEPVAGSPAVLEPTGVRAPQQSTLPCRLRGDKLSDSRPSGRGDTLVQ